MDKYYYLASQLPLLQFGESTNINREGFLREARKWLGEKDFSLLLQADINNFSEGQNLPEILSDYRGFERELRSELSLLREALKAKREYKTSPALLSIVSEGNPLDIEKKLLHLRWKFIEEKEEGHYFDLEFLILYFLKLQILERLFTFNKEKGMMVFDKLCEVSDE